MQREPSVPRTSSTYSFPCNASIQLRQILSTPFVIGVMGRCMPLACSEGRLATTAQTSVRLSQPSTASCQDVALSRVDCALRSIRQALTFVKGFENFVGCPLKVANKKDSRMDEGHAAIGKVCMLERDSICAPNPSIFIWFGLHFLIGLVNHSRVRRETGSAFAQVQ